MPSNYLPGPMDQKVGARPRGCQYPARPSGHSMRGFEVIMIGEAAARPQKLQKRWQMVHRLDKSRRERKVSTTRLNGVFGRAGDDLEGGSGPHS